jgi:hypothetical protein
MLLTSNETKGNDTVNTSTRTTRRIARTIIATAALGLLASACGSDKDNSADTTKPAATTAAPTPTSVDHTTMDHSTMPTTAASSPSAAGTIAVTASDYHFAGVPATIPAGSKLTFTNSSNKEFHEMVVFRLDDSEKRTVPELLALGEEQLMAMFGNAEPAAVLLGPPGGAPQIEAVGDGTLSEPGRYMFVCTIPVGADPAEIAKAMSAPDGPPPAADPKATPHYMAGMWAEAVVA